MKRGMFAVVALFSLLALTAGASMAAAERVPTVEKEMLDTAKVDRATRLLARAVAHYRSRGEQALKDFSESPRFQDGELYVYVVGMDGVFLASGGSSSNLVGRNVADLKDSAGKPFFREIFQVAREHGGGQVEYRWLNRAENREERKLTFFRKVGERILAVGIYIPRATPAQAAAMLDEAVVALQKDRKQALGEIADINGRFVQDDLYVFVVGLDDLRMKAHGAMPHLVGSDGRKLTDANGRTIILEMQQILRTADRGELDYSWRNPITKQIEGKRTFVRRVDNLIVGVGYYSR